MIQRIQTLYLLLVVFLSVLQCFLSIGQFGTADTVYDWKFSEVVDTENGIVLLSTWAMAVLQVVMGVVALVTMFLYKKRSLQMRLSVFNVILMGSSYLLYGYYYWLIRQYIDELMFLDVTVATAFPLVSLILTVLALRAIWKDEVLVRSLNRLR